MRKHFRPQEDITAYEVAVIVARVTLKDRSLWDTSIVFNERQWEEIGELQRHFQDAPEEPKLRPGLTSTEAA
jgi:hypothetical protein